MIIWYISGTSRLSRLRTNPPARNPNPPFGSTAVCGSYPQTRPVWDCHRTADQARGGFRGSMYIWQSQTDRVWDRQSMSSFFCCAMVRLAEGPWKRGSWSRRGASAPVDRSNEVLETSRVLTRAERTRDSETPKRSAGSVLRCGRKQFCSIVCLELGTERGLSLMLVSPPNTKYKNNINISPKPTNNRLRRTC